MNIIFEGYKKEQCDSYLERINTSFDGRISIENLDQLIFQHQKTVPFEDLAVCEGWGTVNLEPEALFEKIVTQRRGGFCFELNSAFIFLLKGLGYDAAGVMCRNAVPRDTFLRRLYHMAIMVRIDGQEYFCDVGLGGKKPAGAVPLTGESRVDNGVSYWIEDAERGWKAIKNDDASQNGFFTLFTPVALLPMDFTAHCSELVGRGDTIFHTTRLLSIVTDDGFIKLSGRTLTITRNGVETIREIDETEYLKLLKDYFGIKKDG